MRVALTGLQRLPESRYARLPMFAPSSFDVRPLAAPLAPSSTGHQRVMRHSWGPGHVAAGTSGAVATGAVLKLSSCRWRKHSRKIPLA